MPWHPTVTRERLRTVPVFNQLLVYLEPKKQQGKNGIRRSKEKKTEKGEPTVQHGNTGVTNKQKKGAVNEGGKRAIIQE